MVERPRAEGGAVEIRAKEQCGERGIGRVKGRQQPGSAEGTLQGGGLGEGGEVRFLAVENVEVRNVFHAPVAAIEPTEEGGRDDTHGDIEVGRPGEQLGERLAVLRLIAPRAGGGEGGDERGVLLGLALGETPRNHEHFFDLARGMGGAPGGAPTDVFADREGIPRLADTVAVDRAGGEIAEHLGGRDDDDTHVAFGIEPGGKQPIPEHQVMRGKMVDDTEGERLAGSAILRKGAERGGVACAGLPQCTGKGNGVAVEVENERGEDFGGGATQAEVGGPKHRRGGMHGVEFAVDNFFANGGPANLASEFDAEAVSSEETEVCSDGERGGVGEGEEAEPKWARAGSRGGRR